MEVYYENNDFNHSYGNCSVDCFFFGAGMNEAMTGAILLSMITVFACTISAIEKNKKE